MDTGDDVPLGSGDQSPLVDLLLILLPAFAASAPTRLQCCEMKWAQNFGKTDSAEKNP